MNQDTINNIENISLSAKQIKAKLEDALAYDHDKFRNIEILFANKVNQTSKLPFSDYKISISEEMYAQELLLEDIKKHIEETKLIEEKVEVEVAQVIKEEEETIEEDSIEYDDEIMHAVAPSRLVDEQEVSTLNVVEEICEYEEDDEENDEDMEADDEEELFAQLPYSEKAKRPKAYRIKVVDVQAIIRKIKEEARIKNEGKPVIGRRQINKLLKPYMIKKSDEFDIDGIDNSLTSIDIYLNAVDKIAHTTESPVNENANDSLELNLEEILDDLDK